MGEDTMRASETATRGAHNPENGVQFPGPLPTTFASIEDFYGARGGERSGEIDFGVNWFDAPAPVELGAVRVRVTRQPHRVSYVRDTGDIYLVGLWDRGVELLGNASTEEEAERQLEGWVDACGGLGSLEWIRARFCHDPRTAMCPHPLGVQEARS